MDARCFFLRISTELDIGGRTINEGEHQNSLSGYLIKIASLESTFSLMKILHIKDTHTHAYTMEITRLYIVARLFSYGFYDKSLPICCKYEIIFLWGSYHKVFFGSSPQEYIWIAKFCKHI